MKESMWEKENRFVHTTFVINEVQRYDVKGEKTRMIFYDDR